MWVSHNGFVCNRNSELDSIFTLSSADYNVGVESIVNQPTATSSPVGATLRKNTLQDGRGTVNHTVGDRSNASVETANDNNNSVYQNLDIALHNSTYNNRETLICDGLLNRTPLGQKEPTENYYNSVAIANDANRLQHFERSHSLRTNNEAGGSEPNGLPMPSHGRTQSLVERKSTSTLTRKIPENLKLNDTFANDADPSPSLSTSSGPYIAISECISGNPLIDRDNPMTPLNSLDPKFYETPRSHINNIGLNLTSEQPYSPKRNNCPPVSNQSWAIFDWDLIDFTISIVGSTDARVAQWPLQPDGLGECVHRRRRMAAHEHLRCQRRSKIAAVRQFGWKRRDRVHVRTPLFQVTPRRKWRCRNGFGQTARSFATVQTGRRTTARRGRQRWTQQGGQFIGHGECIAGHHIRAER